MTVTAHGSGTQTATIGTEHFLDSPAVPGMFTLHVDMVNLADGDIVELRAYQHVLAGGTDRVVFEKTYNGAQHADEMLKISPPLGNDLTEANALRFSLKQTFGTGRAFPWKVLQY